MPPPRPPIGCLDSSTASNSPSTRQTTPPQLGVVPREEPHPPLNDYVQATRDALPLDGRTPTSPSAATRPAEHSQPSDEDQTLPDLNAVEGPIETDEAPDAIRQAAADYETAVRQITGKPRSS